MYKNNQFGQNIPSHSCFECTRPPKFKDTNAINSVMSKFFSGYILQGLQLHTG